MIKNKPLYIDTLAIFGVGLIGGSLAIRLKQENAVGKIIGVGRSRENLERAIAIGAIDEIETDELAAAKQADVIILATPVNTITQLIETIRPVIDESKIVSDVGSVKSEIISSAEKALGSMFSRFVGAHPIAGKEKSGIDAADGELYENHKVILTPNEETDSTACEIIRSMWELTGATVRSMGVTDHDRVLSVTSHLPHILAYVMMDFLSTSDDKENCYEMAAGGFYDFTRTASSDPEMWRDISIMNGPRLLQHIE
jgi:prephenate dehydrogenase